MDLSVLSVIIVLLFVSGVGLLVRGFVYLGEQRSDEGYAYLFFAAGIQLIVTSFGTFSDTLKEILILLKGTQSIETTTCNPYEFGGFNWLQCGVGIILIVVGGRFLRYVRHRIYILNLQGYFPLRIEDHFKGLKLRQFEFKEREIDFITEGKEEMTAEKANDIVRLIERKITSFVNESKGCQIGYTGIAHLPFVMFAGTCLKRKQIDDYFEFNKRTGTYCRLGKKKKYPELKHATDFHQLNRDAQEVVLTVCTTTPILDSQLTQFEHCEVIRFSIEQPKDNAITSKVQLARYKEIIMGTMNQLPSIFPNLKKIHLVCSTQSCLLLEIGKSIEDHRDVPVVGYHFDAESEKKYPWGIVLNGSDRGKFLKG